MIIFSAVLDQAFSIILDQSGNKYQVQIIGKLEHGIQLMCNYNCIMGYHDITLTVYQCIF